MDNCRSIRTFDESRPVTEEMLTAFTDIARKCASAANRQPLKYRFVTGSECAEVQPLTAWAGALSHLELPPKGKMPTAFIMICHDTSISPVSDYAAMDVGIAAQTLALAAAEEGVGCCMIGSFELAALKKLLNLPEKIEPKLVIALGKPAETIVLTDAEDGKTTYYRDEAGVHYVPKRKLEDILQG